MLLGVIAFVVAVLVSVMLHEAGHFLTARKFGMHVSQFFVGFGPTLWSFRRGEVEYGVKAIPAGGFVRISGMSEEDEIAPEFKERAFYKQSAPKKAVVLAAGSTVHMVLGVILAFLAFGVTGLPALSTTIAAVPECVQVGEAAARGQSGSSGCAEDEVAGAAAAAGLRPGERITRIDGATVETWEELVNAVQESEKEAIPVGVSGPDGSRELEIVPARVESDGVERTLLGIQASVVSERQDPIEALGSTLDLMGTGIKGSFTGLASIPSQIPTLLGVGEKERSPEGVIGVVGAARISGQVLESQTTPFIANVGVFLILIAGLNVFIGVFNLLPLLPLDGGHLAVLGYEQARTKLARLRGAPNPGRVDVQKLNALTLTVVAAFVLLSLLLVYADIANPIQF